MDHEEAMRINAPEGYLLNDLTPSERDAFETHMFSCVLCAEDVSFIVSLRELFEDDPKFGSRFRTPHAAAAYVLGALTPDDRKSFEAHLLVCRTCSRNVRLGLDVVTKFRSAVENQSPVENRLADALQFCRWFRLAFGE
jgi:anti-sigma factor RsiW